MISVKEFKGKNMPEYVNKYRIVFPAVVGERIPDDNIIIFQDGPVKEYGVNGCQINDIIDICIHQLKQFQEGRFPCLENELALHQLKSAKEILEIRTKNREQRKVEGFSKA